MFVKSWLDWIGLLSQVDSHKHGSTVITPLTSPPPGGPHCCCTGITLTTLPQDNTDYTMTPSSNNTQQQELMTKTSGKKLSREMCQSHGMAFTLQWVGIKHLRAIVCFQSDCMFCWISTWWWSGWRWRSCVLMTRRRGKNVVASIIGHHGVLHRTRRGQGIVQIKAILSEGITAFIY